MRTSLVDTLYVGVVPPWLTEHVDAGRLTVGDLLDLPTLANILSERDVTLYVAFNNSIDALTDGVFAGMQPLLSKPVNAQWVSDHLEQITAINDELEIGDVVNVKVGVVPDPTTIARPYFQPTASGQDSLLLLGRTTAIYMSYIDYFSAAMRELSMMVGFDQAIASKVLDAFIAANLARVD